MLYVIYGEDHNSVLEKRLLVRKQHLDRLNELKNKGKLIIAGPCPLIDSEDPGPNGFSGSVIIAEFDSLECAKSWANEDPYLIHNVFHKVTVKPFKKVLP